MEHAASPDDEPEEMHRRCSALHLGAWACIHAADAAAAAAFDWAARADDPMVFPAQMADGLLPHCPRPPGAVKRP